MKTLLLLALLAAAPAALRAQTSPPPAAAWTDHRRALPDKLRQVPVGLMLWHSPNPAYPEPNPEQPGGFVWKHGNEFRLAFDLVAQPQ